MLTESKLVFRGFYRLMVVIGLIIIVFNLFGCGEFYVGAGMNSYYPDQLFDKKIGDPRKLQNGGVQSNGSLQIGGNSNTGFKTIGGE